MSSFELKYKPYGESALLIEWPSQMNESILTDILAFQKKIQQLKYEYIFETIQSINSLTVIYNNKTIKCNDLINRLLKTYKQAFPNHREEYYLWKIPVCYDLKFGLDLEEISKSNGLTKNKIIELHSNAVYKVYSIGFLPGFLYLGGLNDQLHINRKATPRLEVPTGAVAIGGKQTGIYPVSSPGGWHIIGNSPVSFFDSSKAIPCFAKPGDKIQFFPISYEDHVRIKNQVTLQNYTLEKEVVND